MDIVDPEKIRLYISNKSACSVHDANSNDDNTFDYLMAHNNTVISNSKKKLANHVLEINSVNILSENKDGFSYYILTIKIAIGFCEVLLWKDSIEKISVIKTSAEDLPKFEGINY
ncbi:hypothetical protein KH5_04060 [Urechidicola sp. KH5]